MIAEPPHLDRARAKIELVDSAIKHERIETSSDNPAGVQATC